MKDLPLITIRTLVYNTGNHVIKSISSIRKQNYPKDLIDHIIIDDFSTDGSREKVEKWINDNNHSCRFIKHNKNWGICKSLNHSLELAKGKYIFGCSDDLISPEKISRQVDILENSPEDTVAVYSDANLIDSNGNLLDGSFIQKYRDFEKKPSGDIYTELLKGNFIPAMATLIQTDVVRELGGYDENLGYEDWDFWLRLSKKYKIIADNYISASYRLDEAQFHKNYDKFAEDGIKIFSKHIDHHLARKKIEKFLVRIAKTDRARAQYLANSINGYRSSIALKLYLDGMITHNLLKKMKKLEKLLCEKHIFF